MKIFLFLLLSIEVCHASKSAELSEIEILADALTYCPATDNGDITEEQMKKFLLAESSFDPLLQKVGGIEAFIKRHFDEIDLDKDGIAGEEESKKDNLIYEKTFEECLKGDPVTELSQNGSVSNSKVEATKWCACFDLDGNDLILAEEIKSFYVNRPSYKDMINAVGGLKRFVKGWMILYDINEDGKVTKKECMDVAVIYLHMIAICH